jgi:hypothetical protein
LGPLVRSIGDGWVVAARSGLTLLYRCRCCPGGRTKAAIRAMNSKGVKTNSGSGFVSLGDNDDLGSVPTLGDEYRVAKSICRKPKRVAEVSREPNQSL